MGGPPQPRPLLITDPTPPTASTPSTSASSWRSICRSAFTCRRWAQPVRRACRLQCADGRDLSRRAAVRRREFPGALGDHLRAGDLDGAGGRGALTLFAVIPLFGIDHLFLQNSAASAPCGFPIARRRVRCGARTIVTSFDFASRAMPGEVAQRGSACSQLRQRGARNGGEFIEQSTIDQPPTHGVHWLLVSSSKRVKRDRRQIAVGVFPFAREIDVCAGRRSRP